MLASNVLTYNTMTKDTIDLMAAVQRAYDRVLRVQEATTVAEKPNLMKLDEAYDAYDALVDSLVESSGGKESAVDTDPLTYHSRQAVSYSGLNITYNEMAEVVGQEAFGN